MKIFPIIQLPVLLLLTMTLLGFAGCQQNSVPGNNKNQTVEIASANVSDSSEETTDEYCEKIYEQVLAENPQNYVSCLSDLKVELRACPKPEGFEDGLKENLNVIIALDSSGSMNGKIAGEQKLAIAKKAINSFVNTLPERANVGLIVYGHRGSNDESQKEASCQGVETIYPAQKLNKGEFFAVVNSFAPTGWTPLASAIDKAGEILDGQRSENSMNLIYVVSDGIETCGGNPVAASTRLHQSNIKAVVNIIGFDVDSQAQQQLKAAATAGGGQYSDARNAGELNQVFGGVSQSVAKYNEYLRCMTANKQDVRRLYGNKQNEISLCLTKKAQAESSVIFKTHLNWSRTDDARRKCAPFFIEQQNAREKRIRSWRDDIVEKMKQEENFTYDQLESELRAVTEKHSGAK